MKVSVYREGAPEVRVDIQIDVATDVTQAAWHDFELQIKAKLDLDSIEGVYTEWKMYPVLCIKTLVNYATYVVRPTEGCALIRSLTVDRNGEYPSLPLVEAGKHAVRDLQSSIDNFPTTAGEGKTLAEFHRHLEESMPPTLPSPDDKDTAAAETVAPASDADGKKNGKGKKDSKKKKVWKNDDGTHYTIPTWKSFSKWQGEFPWFRFRGDTNEYCCELCRNAALPKKSILRNPKKTLTRHEETELHLEIIATREQAALKEAEDMALKEAIPETLLGMLEPSGGTSPADDERNYQILQILSSTARIDLVKEGELKILVSNMPNLHQVARDMQASDKACMQYSQIVQKVAKCGGLVREQISREGAVATLVHIAESRQQSARIQRLMVSTIFCLVRELPKLRVFILDEVAHKLLRSILCDFVERADVILYSVWILLEAVQDPAVLTRCRRDPKLIQAVQSVHTRAYGNEDLRRGACELLSVITGFDVEAMETGLSRLPPIAVKKMVVGQGQGAGDDTAMIADALLLGREHGAL